MDPAGVTPQFRVLALKHWMTLGGIANLVGHGSTSVTKRMHRKELRPVLTRGARAINEFHGDTNR